MPFIKVRHVHLEPCNNREGLVRLVSALPKIVADALSCEDPDGGLTPQDIEVSVEEYGPMDISGDYNLEVIVDANEYPSRLADLKQRTQQIADQVGAILIGPPTKYYVWVRLSPAAFVEGQSS